MKNINKSDLLAAEAVVSAALIGLEGKENLSFHPQLKKLIAHKIANDPSLTMDLFSPKFFNTFVNPPSKNT